MNASVFADAVERGASAGVLNLLYFCLSNEDREFLRKEYGNVPDYELTEDGKRLKRAVRGVEERSRNLAVE